MREQKVYIDEVLRQLVRTYPDLQACVSEIADAFERISTTYRHNGKVLLCGNGGSAADCGHIAGELMKGFETSRKLPEKMRASFRSHFPQDGDFLADHLQGALPAISLGSHTAAMTAMANDISAEMVFAQQVFGYGNKGDALIALSASGNSPNILRAVQVAKVLGLTTVGLTGMHGGKLQGLCDVAVCVPWEQTADIQERHLPIYHALCRMLEKEFFA